MEAQNTQNLEIMADRLPLTEEVVEELFNRPTPEWGIVTIDYYTRVSLLAFDAPDDSPERELQQHMNKIRHKRIEDESRESAKARMRQENAERRQELWDKVRGWLGGISLNR